MVISTFCKAFLGHMSARQAMNAMDELKLTYHPSFAHSVKSGSTPVGGPVKSGWKRTRAEGRGLDKRLVRPELVTAWIQRLRIMSVDPLHRFRSRRGDGDRGGDGQDQE